MPVRLYMDNDSLDRRVIDQLRAVGIDIETTAEAGHQRLPDNGQLEYAASTGRAIYTANIRDFARLHSEWLAAGRTHSGIILRSKQRMPVGAQVRALTAICLPLDNTLEGVLIYI